MVKRVAMLSVHTCPLATLGGKETGGMNVYVRELAREFSRDGIAVDVFTRSQNATVPRVLGGLGRQGRVMHIPAGPEHPLNKNEIYQHIPEFVRHVQQFAAGEGIHYDIIHSHYWLSGLAALELRHSWGVPIMQMFHTMGEMKNRAAQNVAEQEPIQRIESERQVVRLVDRIVAATQLEREQLSKYYDADPDHVSVVPPGVDLKLFRPLRCADAKARIGVERTQQVILFVGRIQPIKGIDTLLQAMALVLRRQPELCHRVCVSIIGGNENGGSDQDHGEMERLKTLREELGIADLVTFLGSKDQDTLVDYYSAAAMVVVPSHYESFGMVALEAMACGTPVIASDVGGLSFNVMDGYNGYLVPDRDPEALAGKITLLLNQRALRNQLSEQARSWVERFSWAKIAGEILSVYDQALAQATVSCEQTA